VKRLLWLGAGFGLGVAAARRARTRAGATGAAGSPSPVGAGGRLRARVNAAIDEGRREARQREVALRNVLAAPEQGPHNPER
jgi:hypothetical protein